MDLKQIEYIIAIANEQNITKAAQTLFMTQSALNQQLLRLERELNTQLFYRSKNSCILTPAGEIYVKNARQILQIKKDTYQMISDLNETQQGNISVGFNPGRGTRMFADVYPRFHALYPNIFIHPAEFYATVQLEMISQGRLDIAFATFPATYKVTSVSCIELDTEALCLVVPDTHPLIQELHEPVNLKLLQSEFFVLICRDSSLRPMENQLFQAAGFTPKLLFETSNTPTILTMVQNGLCCGIVPQYYLKTSIPHIRTYHLEGYPQIKSYACYHSNSYLSMPERAFIQMAKEHWNSQRKDNPL